MRDFTLVAQLRPLHYCQGLRRELVQVGMTQTLMTSNERCLSESSLEYLIQDIGFGHHLLREW